MVNKESDAVPRVVVVEDSNSVRFWFEEVLSEHGYQVTAFSSVHEARQYLLSHIVDLIVLHHFVPDGTGTDVFQDIRQWPHHVLTPVIVISAADDSLVRQRALALGADEFLHKPLDRNFFLAIVRSRVQRGISAREFHEERYASFKRQVVRTLSHEFRTPLTAISAGIDLLKERIVPHEDDIAISLLDTVLRGLDRLERLVKDFITVQQIYSGTFAESASHRRSIIPIGELMASVCEVIKPMIDEASLQLVVDIEPTHYAVHVCEHHILEIIRRLISNSVKFHRGSFPIEIRSTVQDGKLRIAIADRGPGIESGRIREACALFMQLDREVHEQQGAGIGLAVASYLTQINGGRLIFANREDEEDPAGAQQTCGAVVYLELPCAEFLVSRPELSNHGTP